MYFYLSFIGYLDVLMYVPIVYGFLPEINVFVFVCHCVMKIKQNMSLQSLLPTN